MIVVDDILLFDVTTGRPVFADLSDDGTSIWAAVAEKAVAKVIGNYLKTNLGYLDNGLRILTGIPVFRYPLGDDVNLANTYLLLYYSDILNYIITAGTGSGRDTTYNECGLSNGHAYTVLSTFTMTDAYYRKY